MKTTASTAGTGLIALLFVACSLSCRDSVPEDSTAPVTSSAPGGVSKSRKDGPRWALLRTIDGVEFVDSTGRFGGGVIYVDLDKPDTSCSVTLHRGVEQTGVSVLSQYRVGKSKVDVATIGDARHLVAIFGSAGGKADASGVSRAYARSLRSAERTLAASRHEAIEEDEDPSLYLDLEVKKDK